MPETSTIKMHLDVVRTGKLGNSYNFVLRENSSIEGVLKRYDLRRSTVQTVNSEKCGKK